MRSEHAMIRGRGPTAFLASVANEREARVCLHSGADIIDCKDPGQGVLGALPPDKVAAVRACLPAGVPVSATIGDVSASPDIVADRVATMAATGVDFIKIGFCPGAEAERCAAWLGRLSIGRCRLVGLLFADLDPDFRLIRVFRQAGFAGAMLDTADKTAGALPSVLPGDTIGRFVASAGEAELFVGLAGALRLAHIPDLLGFAPDVLGFRGALCRAGLRDAPIDADAVAAVRRAIPRSATAARAPVYGTAAPFPAGEPL